MADDSDAASRGKTSSTEDVSNVESKDRNSDGNFLNVDTSDNAQSISRARRSSLIKDPNKRPMKKKTVSFSSMPNERSVTNGTSEILKYKKIEIEIFVCDCIFTCHKSRSIFRIFKNRRGKKRAIS